MRVLEQLEARRLLALVAPTGVWASFTGQVVEVTWVDLSDEEVGYLIERSHDGVNDWEPASELLPADTEEGEDPALAAPQMKFRVVAVGSGDTRAESSAVGVSLPVFSTTDRLQLTASAITDGVRLEWIPLDSTMTLAVHRKALGATSWSGATSLGTVSSDNGQFDDTTAGTGTAWEYRVSPDGSPTSAMTKYIVAGNAVDPVHDRGTILLLVDETQLDGTGPTIQPELDQLRRDLIGEGYTVVVETTARVEVPRTLPADTNPTTIASHFGPWKNAVLGVKNQIRDVYVNRPDLEAAILIGHVPVPYSGLSPADGHLDHRGAWPADVFYSTLTAPDSVWTSRDTTQYLPSPLSGDNNYNIANWHNANYVGDGKFDIDSLSQLDADPVTGGIQPVFSDIAIGRIDTSMLSYLGTPGTAGSEASTAETNLLKNHLARNHDFRTGELVANRQALIDRAVDFVGYYEPTRLTTNVGQSSVLTGAASVRNGDEDKTDHDLNNDTWLWTYIAGGGARNAGGDYVHIEGPWNSSPDRRDFGGGNYANSVTYGVHKGIFNMIFGSYVGDWGTNVNVLKTAIADPDGYGLIATWGLFNAWHVHPMGLGGTMGDSLIRTQNNFSDRMLYPNGNGNGSTDLSILGDITLRQDNVAPVSDVVVSTQQAGSGESAVITTTIEWTASPDAGVGGYHVYRSDSPDGPFTLLNTTAVTGTSYVDETANPEGETYYLVRAARLEATPSGTYWNLSTGLAGRQLVEISNFVWNEPPQSFTFHFNQDVESILTDSSFTITGETWNNGTQTFTPITFVAGTDFELVDYDGDVATVRFLGQSELGVNNTLPSGRYTISVSVETESALGQTILSSHAQAILFVAGDTNNDGIVDFSDMLVLAQNYNQTSLDWANSFGIGDFDNDDDVDFDDLLILAQYYNVNLN